MKQCIKHLIKVQYIENKGYYYDWEKITITMFETLFLLCIFINTMYIDHIHAPCPPSHISLSVGSPHRVWLTYQESHP